MGVDPVTKLRVAIIGVGTMGSMAMWRLAERGAHVEGFEKFGMAHDFGAAGGGTRVFRMVYAEGSRYLPLLATSRLFWHELARRNSADILVRNGCLTIADATSVQIQRSIRMAEQCQLPFEVLTPEMMAAIYPQHQLAEHEVGVFDPEGGVLRTDRAIGSAIKSALASGAILHSNSTVEAIEPGDHGVNLIVGGQTHHFDEVVVSTGPWGNPILERFGYTPEARRVRTSFHRPRHTRLHEPAHFPSVIRRIDDGRSYGAMHALDGNTVKFVIQNSETALPVLADDVGEVPINENFLAETVDLISLVMPEVDPYPVRVGAHPEGFTVDGEPLVGRLDGVPHVVVLGGFSGQGFKMAPAIGEIAADLILADDQLALPSTFDPNRLAPGADRTRLDLELAELWFDVDNSGTKSKEM